MESVSFLPSFLKMLFSLAVVIGLLVGAMYFFRRILQHTTVGANADSGVINILAARYVGPKSSIMLVEVLGNVLVVGISSNQMSHLATISDPAALEKLKYKNRQEKIVPSVADYLKRHKVGLRIFDCFGKDNRKK